MRWIAMLALAGCCACGSEAITMDGRGSGGLACEPVDLDPDRQTALGFAPGELWDAFEGHYDEQAYWIDDPEASPDPGDDGTIVSVDVARIDGVPQVDDCSNEVRVPVSVAVETDDGAYSQFGDA